MKKFIYLLMGLGLLASCEEDLLVYDTPEGFVQFSSASGSITEAADEGPSVTTVLLGDGENPNGVTVDFTITASDPSRFTVEPSGGSIEIPAGSFSADIVITPVDNFQVDGDMDIVLELLPSSSVPIGIGGEGNEGLSRTVTLVDDDCPVDLSAFIGTFSVEEVFTSGTNEGLTLAGAFGQNYQLEISAQPGDASGTRLVINNTAGFNTYLPNGTVIQLQACPGTVGFTTNPINVALFADMTIETTSFNEEGRTITAAGPLGGFGPYEFVLTRQ
ncbi:hypothetical protein [Robiginitalea sp. SC105]|uniref:hypothetical protein n=1 Tax=Robiginitalea sp. SC105 TaxID=2762332 RepID=UPI00163A433D|nr:hypothetical protein [Robiginitalea sp. SC105]MBC2837702.1 hypothetical protein [Robiginitalea sp. SC105]